MKQLVAVLVLLPLVLLSAQTLVYYKHQERRLYGQWQQLRLDYSVLQQQFERYQLQRSELSTLPVIDELATRRLGMVVPDPERIVYLTRRDTP